MLQSDQKFVLEATATDDRIGQRLVKRKRHWLMLCCLQLFLLLLLELTKMNLLLNFTTTSVPPSQRVPCDLIGIHQATGPKNEETLGAEKSNQTRLGTK